MPKSMWPAAPIAIALALGACASPAESPTAEQCPQGARLTPAEAARIATDVARAKGIDLTKFSEPMAHYKPGTWVVLFEGTEQPRRPGDHFGVVINDNTGEASFQGGA